MKEGETIDVLEIGGGSGTNFKSVPFPTKSFTPKLFKSQSCEIWSQFEFYVTNVQVCRLFLHFVFICFTFVSHFVAHQSTCRQLICCNTIGYTKCDAGKWCWWRDSNNLNRTKIYNWSHLNVTVASDIGNELHIIKTRVSKNIQDLH